MSELRFAASQSGTDIEELEGALKKMQRTIGEAVGGSKSAADGLTKIGVSIGYIASLSPEKQFKLIADRIANIQNPTLRAAAAIEIFGRSGTRMIPLLEGGAAGIEQLQKQARALGLTMSGKMAADAEKLNDALGAVSDTFKQLVVVTGAQLAPKIVELSNAVAVNVAGVIRWVIEHGKLIVLAAKGAAAMVAVGAAFYAAGAAATVASKGIGLLAFAWKSLAAVVPATVALIASIPTPLAVAAAAAVGFSAAWIGASGNAAKAVDWLVAKFGELRVFVGDVVGGIADALAADDIQLASQILWNGIRVAWAQGSLTLQKEWAETWIGMQVVYENIINAVTERWINFIANIKSTWSELTGWFGNLTDTIGNMIESWALALEGVVPGLTGGENLSAEEIRQRKADLDHVTAVSQDARNNRTSGDIVDVEVERAKTMAAANEEHLKKLREIVGSGTSASLTDAQAQLDKARAELAASRDKAKSEREAVGAGFPGGTPVPTFDTEKLAESMSASFARLNKTTTSGTFSAFGIGGLAGNTSERIAKFTEETARNTRRLANGLAFV